MDVTGMLIYLNYLLFAYRVSVQVSTRESPSFYMAETPDSLQKLHLVT